jgi:hypothetical protein
VLVAFVGTVCAACSAILGLEPPPSGDDGGPPNDATMGDDRAGDGASNDGGGDGTICAPLDAALPDGVSDVATTWSPLGDFAIDDAGDRSFQFFDLSGLNVLAGDFQGGTFDGRFVYYVPAGNGLIVRFDTTHAFNDGSAWSTFDATTLSSSAQKFSSAVFDGRYVYFIPHTGGSYGGLVVRYDTTGTFIAGDGGAAWTVFDVTTVPVPDGGAPAHGFYGGVFDGRYVYLVPYGDATSRLGRVARYDTQAPDGGVASDGGDGGVSDAAINDGGDGGTSDAGDGAAAPHFGSPSQWSTYDMAPQEPSALGYLGGVYDGRYVYLVPWNNGGSSSSGTSGTVARYDTKDAGFTAPGSWVYFDILNNVNQHASGFAGGAFDGRYVYFVPHYRSLVTRYDTSKAFGTPQAWSTFDLAQVISADGGASSFACAAFDGRFVYIVSEQTAYGYLARYDTLSTFEATCAWSVYDVSQIKVGAAFFFGAVFDGRYLYAIPKGTLAVRFDTKTPAWMPNLPAYNGSTF